MTPFKNREKGAKKGASSLEKKRIRDVEWRHRPQEEKAETPSIPLIVRGTFAHSEML